jgi:peptidoglycan-associated lipoprotein
MKTKLLTLGLSFIFAIDAFAIGLNFTPLKLDGAGKVDSQGWSTDQVQVTPPSLGNYLLKDTAGAARNTAALGLAVKDPSVSAATAARLAAAAMRERIVYFDLNSSSVRLEAIPIIEAHARRLIEDTKLHVALEGHANESLGREFSVALAQRRAESVREILSLLGVSEYQIEVVSFGKEKPAVPGNTEAAMQENRRVEISYR